jgi:hypothetical protein
MIENRHTNQGNTQRADFYIIHVLHIKENSPSPSNTQYSLLVWNWVLLIKSGKKIMILTSENPKDMKREKKCNCPTKIFLNALYYVW